GLMKRLKEPAPSPRMHVPDLDVHWERTILQCLERNPADRFSTVEDVVRGLADNKTAVRPPAVEAPKPVVKRSPALLLTGAIALSCILIGALAWRLLTGTFP